MRRRTLLRVAPAVVLATPLLHARSAHAADQVAADQVAVIATFTILGDIASAIGGDHVRVTTLVGADGDVHTYEPRPSDLRALHQAGVLVENGLGLEGWMTRLAGAAKFGGVRVIASTGVAPRSLTEHGRRITDPHAWQDPRNGEIYARNIAAALAQAMPAHADGIHASADAYVAQLRAVDTEMAATFAAIPAAQRRIITSHDAFGYFAARYGIVMQAAQGISTDEEPSAREIAALSSQIRREHIRAVFIENMTDPRLAEVLAREAGAIVGSAVYSDALSPPGGPADTYLKMFSHNTKVFAEAMARN